MQWPVDLLERLAGMSPGADLAAALGCLDLAGAPNHRLVDVLRAQARQLAHDQARMLATISEVSRSTPFRIRTTRRCSGCSARTGRGPRTSGRPGRSPLR